MGSVHIVIFFFRQKNVSLIGNAVDSIAVSDGAETV